MLRLCRRFQSAALTRAFQSPASHVKAIYSTFPASLIYYSPRRAPGLFDHRENETTRAEDPYNNGVVIAKDGLVYPGVDKHSVSNGAVMLPNTFIMQKMIRRYVDAYLDRAQDGNAAEPPYIYTVSKGSQIPGNLVLINEYSSRFSLQPSRGTSLQDLNRSLGHFFQQSATKALAEEWLDSHPYEAAMSDEVDQAWTSK